jgi:hypothetical protein
MTQTIGYWAELFGIQLDESNNSTWVHALPLGKFTHPVFGEIDITAERVQRFANSVKNKVRGIDLDIDYDHKAQRMDAAGWVKDADARADGLWLFVEFTKEAASKIKEKAYRYFSGEFLDKWTNPQTNETFVDVISGGGLTNRPFLKNLMPLNLSEYKSNPNEEKTSTSITNNPDTPSSDSSNTQNDNPSVPPTPSKEEEVDPKKLAELMGLPADATEEDIKKKFTELLAPPAPPAPPTPPTPEPTPVPSLPGEAELLQLAETNPAAKILIDHVKALQANSQETAKKLHEETVRNRLSQFDDSKMVLTPKAKEIVWEIFQDEKFPIALAEKMWNLLDEFKKGNGFVVELGERTSGMVHLGEKKTAHSRFEEAVKAIQLADPNMSYPDALEKAGKENPALYDEYREESFLFKG